MLAQKVFLNLTYVVLENEKYESSKTAQVFCYMCICIALCEFWI